MGRFRRFIMGATDSIAIATIAVAAIVGAAVGAPIGDAMDATLGGRGIGIGVGILFGAIAGFLPAALTASIAFSLAETATNTRSLARSIAGIAAAGSDEPDDDARPAAAAASADWLLEDDGAKGTVSMWLAAAAAILAIGGGGVLIGNQAWRRGAAVLSPDLLQRPPIQVALAILAVGLVAAATVWRWPAFAGTLMLAGGAGVFYGTSSATSVVSGPAIAAFVAGALVAFAASYAANRSER